MRWRGDVASSAEAVQIPELRLSAITTGQPCSGNAPTVRVEGRFPMPPDTPPGAPGASPSPRPRAASQPAELVTSRIKISSPVLVATDSDIAWQAARRASYESLPETPRSLERRLSNVVSADL